MKDRLTDQQHQEIYSISQVQVNVSERIIILIWLLPVIRF